MTVEYQSASTRLFQEGAEDLALRFEREGSAESLLLAEEARELAARFAEWHQQRPTDEVRVATIQRLFALNRRAADINAA